MGKTISAFGVSELSRIDQSIFLSKEFVQVWRISSALERIQFLDYLEGKSTCPEKLLGIYSRLAFLPVDSGYDFVCTAHLLGSTPYEYRELRSNRADCFKAVSSRGYEEPRICSAV